ncbi:MAG: hypothetical protein LBC92_05140 [Rickettsiales bacterium]|jgi:hypothetical protein|nr:hypothetical protein [Rickettsiales bacterium]
MVKGKVRGIALWAITIILLFVIFMEQAQATEDNKGRERLAFLLGGSFGFGFDKAKANGEEVINASAVGIGLSVGLEKTLYSGWFGSVSGEIKGNLGTAYVAAIPMEEKKNLIYESGESNIKLKIGYKMDDPIGGEGSDFGIYGIIGVSRIETTIDGTFYSYTYNDYFILNDTQKATSPIFGIGFLGEHIYEIIGFRVFTEITYQKYKMFDFTDDYSGNVIKADFGAVKVDVGIAITF